MTLLNSLVRRLSGSSKPLLVLALLPLLTGFAFHVSVPRPQASAAAPLRQPLAFSQYLVNLGPVEAKRSHPAWFRFRNLSDELMELRDLKTSCGCLAVGFTRDRVEPGKTGELTLQIESAHQPAGPRTYTADVVYGPPGDPDVEYTTRLTFRIVLPERTVRVNPRVLIFHQPNANQTAHTIDVNDLRDEPLSVLDVDSDSELLGLEVVPIRFRSSEEKQAGLTGRVRVIVGAVPPGRHETIVRIHTDDPEFKTLKVPVRIHGPAERSVSHQPLNGTNQE